jgi:UDP-N-acetylmuramate-alanine ligase
MKTHTLKIRVKKQKNVQVLQKISDVVEYIDKNRFSENTVIVTMGAGDVYKITRELRLVRDTDDYTR